MELGDRVLPNNVCRVLEATAVQELKLSHHIMGIGKGCPFAVSSFQFLNSFPD